MNRHFYSQNSLIFFKKRSFDSKNWEQVVSLDGKPEQLEKGRGVMHGCLASRAPGKPPLYTVNVALDPSRRNPRTVSSGNTGRRAF